MDAIKRIRSLAKKKLMTIVLPEYDDERTLEAARIVKEEKIAKPLVLTPDMIDKNQLESYIEEYYKLYQSKDISLDIVKKLFSDNLYYAAMMTREGKADGFIQSLKQCLTIYLACCRERYGRR